MRNATARQLADRMVELGMLGETKSAEVLARIDKWGDGDDSANDPLELRDLVSCLPEFGVAVSIHADDVDDVDDYYRSILEDEVLAVTGGAVVITDVTLLETDDGDEWLYFLHNDEPVWWTMEHASHDYVDMLTMMGDFGDLNPGGDDPREFFLHRPEEAGSVEDQYFVFATREQVLALRDEFGIGFGRGFGDIEPLPSRSEERAEVATFLSGWKSGMDDRLSRWRQDFVPTGFGFDFTLKSLEALERLVLNSFTDEAAFVAAQDGPFVTGAVAYLGETLIRAESGVWDYRAGHAIFDRTPLIVSDVPITFRATIAPSYLLRSIADKRRFGLLEEAAEELREASEQYSLALRLLESAGEDSDDEDFYEED